MLPFLEQIQPELMQVNDSIQAQLRSEEPLVEEIGHHLINAGGKRLRPILVILCVRALSTNETLPRHALAAVIEFIHTATLLHDDVVDVSKLRRGLPTANARWGNAPSVLVGDFLYSRAFQMMVSIGNMDIMQILSQTTNIIAEGEVQQLANARNPHLSEGNYLNVIYKKTAALFEAACECGAALVNAHSEQRALLKNYGHNLGMAFQLMDDFLDYQGDASELGKNIGDDLAEGKATLPLIRTLQNCSKKEAELIQTSIRNADKSPIASICQTMESYGGFEYTRKLAESYANKAQNVAAELPASQWREHLIVLAQFAIGRKN